jgi:hypothetical protein
MSCNFNDRLKICDNGYTNTTLGITHSPLSEVYRYARRFGSWQNSYIQVISFHCTGRFLLLFYFKMCGDGCSRTRALLKTSTVGLR